MYYKSSLSIFLHSFGRVRKCSACAFAKDRSYLSPSHLPNPKARGKERKRGGPSTYLPTRLTSPAPLSSTLDSRLHYIVASNAKFRKRYRFWPCTEVCSYLIETIWGWLGMNLVRELWLFAISKLKTIHCMIANVGKVHKGKKSHQFVMYGEYDCGCWWTRNTCQATPTPNPILLEFLFAVLHATGTYQLSWQREKQNISVKRDYLGMYVRVSLVRDVKTELEDLKASLKI